MGEPDEDATTGPLAAFLLGVMDAPPGGLIFCLGATLRTIEQDVLDVLQQPDGPFRQFAGQVTHAPGTATATIFGRVVHLLGTRSAEHRLRGACASFIYIHDEAQFDRRVWMTCQIRLRVPGARMLVSDGRASYYWLSSGSDSPATEPVTAQA